MSGASYRAKAIAALAQRPHVNAAMDENCCGREDFLESQDMGIANFVYLIALPMQPDFAGLPDDGFACVFEPKRWIKRKLGGDQLTEYCGSLVGMLDNEPVHRQNRLKMLLIEAQIAPRNPHMYASATIHVFFSSFNRFAIAAFSSTSPSSRLFPLWLGLSRRYAYTKSTWAFFWPRR